LVVVVVVVMTSLSPFTKGPTGVGKTEIARRLAKLAQAPFIKVEATKFTELGFHGRDVDTIIRDLVEVAVHDFMVKAREREKARIKEEVDEKLLSYVTGSNSNDGSRNSFRDLLKTGELESRMIDFELPQSSPMPLFSGIDSQPGIVLTLDKLLPFRKPKRKMTIAECRYAPPRELSPFPFALTRVFPPPQTIR